MGTGLREIELVHPSSIAACDEVSRLGEPLAAGDNARRCHVMWAPASERSTLVPRRIGL